jgi:hypothetical protein
MMEEEGSQTSSEGDMGPRNPGRDLSLAFGSLAPEITIDIRDLTIRKPFASGGGGQIYKASDGDDTWARA